MSAVSPSGSMTARRDARVRRRFVPVDPEVLAAAATEPTREQPPYGELETVDAVTGQWRKRTKAEVDAVYAKGREPTREEIDVEIRRVVGSDLSRAQCSNLAAAILALTKPRGEPAPSLATLRQAIINNTTGDMFWIGEILLCELEKETGFGKHAAITEDPNWAAQTGLPTTAQGE